ncbi:hypothetical protein ACL02T_10245 [Pseudonocardia sp. RS010]|uniref:hypothetical protein n=1 Tax=Pseudonocardia sp. RS010 TaxID=3385979 RepID=UPI00399F4CB1
MMESVLYSLLAISCPFGMALMWVKERGKGNAAGHQAEKVQIAELRREIDQLKAARAAQRVNNDA